VSDGVAELSELVALADFFFSSRRRHTRSTRDWSSDVCSSDLYWIALTAGVILPWVIRGKLIKIGLEDGGLVSGLRVWARLCLFRSEERRVGKECGSGWGAARGGSSGRGSCGRARDGWDETDES